MNRCFNKLVVLLFSIFINTSFCDGIKEANQSISDMDEVEKVFNDFLQKQEEIYPGQDIMGGYQDSILKLIEHQAKMVETLPEACRQDVISAWETWVDLIDKLENPTDFFLELCNSLYSKIDQDKRLDPFVKVLEEIIGFLNSKDLSLVLQFGFFDEPTKEVLNSLFERLDVVFNDTYNLLPNLSKDLDFLYECLLSLKNQNIRSFFMYKLDILKPEVDEAINKLNIAKSQLRKIKKSLKSSDKDLKEAVEFWEQGLQRFDELKDGYKKGNFFGQDNGSGKWLSILKKLAPYIKNGYHLYNNFFQLLRYDNEGKSFYKFNISKLLKLQFADAFKVNFANNNLGSKPLVMGAFLVDKVWSSLLIPINLLGVVQEKMSGHSYNSMVVNQFMWQFIATCQVLIYYNTMHRSFLKDGFAWPNEYKPFQKMLWRTGKDVVDLSTNYMKDRIKDNVDLEVLEKVSDCSLGILRPELIRFSVNTALPVMAHRYVPKHIVHLKRGRVFKPDPWDWHYVGRTDFDSMSDAEFVENRILGYLAVSMGYHFGKSVAFRNRTLLKGGFGKIGKFLLAKMGFLEEDFIDGSSRYRDLIIKEIGFLVRGGKEDDMFVSARKMFFALILQFGLVKKSDVTNVELAIERDTFDEQMLSGFVDKIMTNIADGIVKQVGGGLGAWGSWHLADRVVRSYGPFFA